MIPKYNKQNIDAGTVTRQTTGMASAAEAQGQAGVAQAQRGLAAQHGQRAGQELASFANRLDQFARTLDHTLNVTAKQQAANKASNDILKMKNDIRTIEEDPKLDDATRAQRIDEKRIRLKDMHTSVYSAAYANGVQADFNNQITIDAAEKAVEAANASKHNPEMFKEAYRQYEKELIDSAPDTASRLVAQQAFDKEGLSTYKRLYKSSMANMDKEAKKNFEIASGQLKTQYENEMTNGDIDAANETQVQYNAMNQSAASRGYITQTEAVDNGYKLNVGAQQIQTQTVFNEAFDAGQGTVAYEQIKSMSDAGKFNHWEPSKRKALLTGMETKITQRATDVYKRVETSFTNGDMPTEREMQEAQRYLPYMSEKNQRMYNIQKKATEVYYGIRDEKLPVQVTEVSSMSNREDLSFDERTIVAGLNKIVNQKVAKAKSDPIALGNEEGLFKADHISPATSTAAMMEKRYLEAGSAATQYGFGEKFFTKSEEAQIKDFMVDPTIPAKSKLEFITKIDQGTNGNSSVAFEQMNKKGSSLFAAAGDLVNDKRPALALNVLKGQQFFNEGTLEINSKDLQVDISDSFGNSFFLAGQGDAAKSKAAVQGLYAYYVAQGEDPDIEDVAEEVLGSKSTFNGQDFYAPTGVDADEVVDFFEDLAPDKMVPIMGVTADETANAINRSKPLHVGKGRYQFVFQGMTLQNIDGTPYELEYINEN